MTTSDWCVGLPENRFEASNAGSPRKEKGTPWWLSRASKMGCSVVEQRADLGINFLLGCRGNVRLFLEYNKSRYFSRWIFPAIEIERDNKSYRMNTRWDKTTFKSSKVVNPGRVITGTKSSQFFPIGRSQHNLFVYSKKILESFRFFPRTKGGRARQVVRLDDPFRQSAEVIDHESLLHRFRIEQSAAFFSAAETRFTLKTVDRSCLERPPARYANARQLISNSRPNGLRARICSLVPLQSYPTTSPRITIYKSALFSIYFLIRWIWWSILVENSMQTNEVPEQ